LEGKLMDLGIILGDTPTTVKPQDHFTAVMRQVEAVQRNGMKYILIGQHFLFPESRWLQPIPLLARLAAEVDRDVRLVTQVLIAPLYPPVLLAEELATLDIVTEGRLIVGLGVGYLPHEYASFGVPFDERVARLEECVEILRAMWTNDRVTFDGRFTKLSDVPVHIRPVQSPHPPIWIGAQSKGGVRRAARIGDAWPITPQEPPDQVRDRLGIFVDERERLGLPVTPQPLRREIVVSSDRDDAISKAVAMAQPWYLHMAEIGNEHMNRDEVIASMAKVVDRTFVLGSADQCAAQLRAIGDVAPIGPVITRASWPGMSADAAVEYLDSLGEELVPAMREYVASPVLIRD
jgi:alkanesulfonate monooxygenase SsuD/methylene tetrahydromethanopterin reductase-like flavin-dependent oxidoreductase (luciferase family)